MRVSTRMIALVVAVGLLIAAPLVSARGGGGDYGGGSYGGGSYGGDSSNDCSSSSYRYSSGSGSYGGGSGDLNVYGVTADRRLICFRSDNPGGARSVGQITGLTVDTRLVGIDYRQANGLLYGLGNAGGVYRINEQNAAATLVSRLNVALQGSSFGVDFNPTVDRMRIISDTGQNLRANVDTGATLVDGTLNYPGPPPATATGVTGAAYTNNDNDPNTATTLYDIDSMMDQTVIQSPANSGQLAATGKLGVDTNSTIGSDIYSTVRNGSTVNVMGFASLTVGGQARFYRITLFTGRASLVGSFSSGNQVTAIAIPLGQL